MESGEQRPGIPREPFAAEPLDPVESAGCGKPVLIGCAALLLLAAIAFVVFLLNADRMLAWSLERSRVEILARLPPEIEPAERQRLDAAFDGLLAALREGSADPRALAQLQAPLLRAAGRIERLERADVIELTRALERAAGRAPPAGESPRLPASAATEAVAAA